MFLPEAKGEIYNIATSETLTWGEIAKHYEETLGLEIELCETEEFCRLIAGQNRMTWANNILYYDRLYNRSVDNSKVLRATGLKSEDLMPIRKGLTLATEGILPAGFTALDAFLEQNKK
jgi:nucleoside-diphosphate-sugar epimerase